MSRFAESLKRLYREEKVTQEKIAELKASGRITAEEFRYITG